MKALWTCCKYDGPVEDPFIKYFITENSIVVYTGWFNTTQSSVMLYRVRDVVLIRNVFNHLWGTGTLKLMVADKNFPVVYIRNIKNSEQVLELVNTLVRDNIKEMGMHPRELITDSDYFEPQME
jgi:hypothetical protein